MDEQVRGAPGLPASPGAEAPAGELARFVAAAMAQQELTLAQVASRGGLAVATVAALRAGTRGKRPRTHTMDKLARGLGVPVEQVLAAASASEASPAAAREVELLALYRRLQPCDQQVAVRLLAELARCRALADPVAAGG